MMRLGIANRSEAELLLPDCGEKEGMRESQRKMLYWRTPLTQTAQECDLTAPRVRGEVNHSANGKIRVSAYCRIENRHNCKRGSL